MVCLFVSQSRHNRADAKRINALFCTDVEATFNLGKINDCHGICEIQAVGAADNILNVSHILEVS